MVDEGLGGDKGQQLRAHEAMLDPRGIYSTPSRLMPVL
jgi:hypothetical protein